MTFQGWVDPPEDVRERDTYSDPDLLPEEKETSLSAENDRDSCRFYSEIGCHIKWALSVEESDVEKVRIDEEGNIIGIKARIPKGVVKFQGNARKSDSNSQMTTYGPLK